MTTIDVFNGDADGICALIQYRHAFPNETELVTGVKRDIKLLNRISAKHGDEINVFDISMETNQEGLRRLLSQGASIFYVDHHLPGEIPDHPGLTAIIDTAADTCTSLLVDKHLSGKYREWAIVAAYGDNIIRSAEELGKTLSLNKSKAEQLKQLGICINYNGYGHTVDDLHFRPDELYRKLSSYLSPFDFIHDKQSFFEELLTGYQQDMTEVKDLKPMIDQSHIAVYETLR